MARASSSSRSLVRHSASNTLATKRLSGSTWRLAALCQIGFILRTFHLQMAQSMCFVRALGHLVLYSNGQRQGLWGHTLNEKRSNRSIQIGTRNTLTGRLSLLNAFALTEIIGYDALTCSLV